MVPRCLMLALMLLLAACNDPVTPRSPEGFDVVTAPPARGVPGWRLRDTIEVRLVDDGGEPFRGVPVRWDVQAGGGSVAALPDTVDDGLSRAVWTLGPVRGENRLSASAPGDLRVVFETVGTAFRADRVAAGYSIACGLADEALWCWGEGSGYVSVAPSEQDAVLPVWEQAPGLVDDSREYADVAAASGAGCALDKGGTAWCTWHSQAAELEMVAGAPPLASIAGGGWRPGFCGLATSDSTAWCWSSTDRIPIQVPGSPAFVSLDVSEPSVLGCGLLADSTAACWGDGPLGDGTTASSAVPVTVSGGRRFAEIVVGDRAACGREADGDVWCWGVDTDASLSAPVDVTEPVLATTGAVRIGADGWYMSALDYAARIQRWYYAVPNDDLPPLTGLEQLRPVRFASGSSWCVQTVDWQTYCIAEMQFVGTPNRYDEYVPIQPVLAE